MRPSALPPLSPSRLPTARGYVAALRARTRSGGGRRPPRRTGGVPFPSPFLEPSCNLPVGARLADRRRDPADGLRGAAGAWVCDGAHPARMDPLPRARRAGGGVCGVGGGAASNGDGGGGGDGRRGAAGRRAENCGGRGKESCGKESCGKEGSSADCASVTQKNLIKAQIKQKWK